MATTKMATTKSPASISTSVPKQYGAIQYGAILIRGVSRARQDVVDTLAMLRLRHKNHCVLLTDSPSARGMLAKVKDYITWGEVSPAVVDELIAKRGEEFTARVQDAKKKYSYRYLEHSGKKYQPYFRLNPPRKGFERKGTKVAFRAGGALGYRGAKMDDLLRRMM